MVVVIQPGLGQAIGLLAVQHAQCHASLEAFLAHPLHHFQHAFEIPATRVAPRRAHTKAAGAGLTGGARGFDHCIDIHQFFRLDSGFMVHTLRTVATIFRTTPCLDTQQSTDLHLVGVEIPAVDLLSTVQQVIERQLEQGLYFVLLPVKTQCGRIRTA